MSLDPIEVMNRISEDAAALDGDGKDIHDAILDLQEAEQAYQEARNIALIELMDEYKAAGERLPAEDMRSALVHRRVDKKLYGRYLSAKARTEALRAWTRTRENALSARQSLLSTLREEARAVG